MTQKNNKKNTNPKKQKKSPVAQSKSVNQTQTTFANRLPYAQIILPQFVF